MKFSKLSIFLLLSLFLVSCEKASDRLLNRLQPQQDRAVYDYANVISASDEQKLELMAGEMRQKTGASMVVVTLPSLEGGEIDDFTNRLFEKWSIGQKGKDNGLLYLAAMQEKKMRIEVGYGLEGAIPDSVAGRIRRDLITPSFQQGNPGKGIVAGMAALSQEVAQEFDVELKGASTQIQSYSEDSRGGSKKVNPIFVLIFLLFFIPFAIRHPFLAMMLLSGGRGGGYRSGGFGGGSGGFGGGMSGGGGSSGGW